MNLTSWSRRALYAAAVFGAGLLAGAGAMSLNAQSNRIPGNNGLNHVGIVVDNLGEAIAAYNTKFGYGEAAVLRDEKGQPTLAFIQISRNTFIELSPSSPTRRAGLDHFGIQVDDVKAATTALQQRGVKIDDPRAGRTVSFITSTTEPYGVRMEMSELRPESMLGKAIAGWK
jgi:catechol 2,3-dioxygenase-like lactoylglutathione lyase family enzyme